MQASRQGSVPLGFVETDHSGNRAGNPKLSQQFLSFRLSVLHVSTPGTPISCPNLRTLAWTQRTLRRDGRGQGSGPLSRSLHPVPSCDVRVDLHHRKGTFSITRKKQGSQTGKHPHPQGQRESSPTKPGSHLPRNRELGPVRS